MAKRAETYVNMDAFGLALLGNALVLAIRMAMCRCLLTADASIDAEFIARFRTLGRGLADVLRPRGCLDRDLANIAGYFDQNLDPLGELAALDQLAARRPPYAELTLRETVFTPWQTAEFDLTSGLAPGVVGQCIHSLPLDDMTLKLASVVISGVRDPRLGEGFWPKNLAALENWSWDAEVKRLAKERDRAATGWANKLLARAERHFFQPLLAQTTAFDDGEEQRLAELAIKVKAGDRPEDLRFFDAPAEALFALCDWDGDATKDAIINGFFAPDIHSFGRSAYADEGRFLLFCADQIAWWALGAGEIFCLAEDVVKDRRFYTHAAATQFPPLGEPGRIYAPDELELGVNAYFVLQLTLQETVGADRLWFVLRRELQTLANGSKPGPKPPGARGKEREALDVLKAVALEFPGAKLRREDAELALTKGGFSERQAKRLWDQGAPPHWKKSGKPKASTPKIPPEAILERLT